MHKHFFIFLSFLVMFLLTPFAVFASEYFETSYYVTYEVQETGQTEATIDVTLRNKTSDYYASSYKVQVGFPEITEVKAEDPAGELTPKVTKVADGNVIEAEFNEKVVGQDNSLTYSITFTTPNVASRNGAIWVINIPGISNPSNFDTFTVDVNVPESFGTPRYIKPSYGTEETLFTKEQLGTSGISIAYGQEQIYAYDLTYHLENTNLFPVRTEIALPPTTNYQESYIDSIEPKPDNVVIDEDGNWLAKYSLTPAERLDVTVKGHALVNLTPKKEVLSESERQRYLAGDTYWDIHDPEIQRLAKELKTPRAIYDFVVQNLTYDFTRVEEGMGRLGGAQALMNNESAVCLEFTDLFITLARAAGIPAREVDGYAHTENTRQRPLSLVQDILHAWPEYYDSDQQTWIMVDPTWGNTTGGVDYFNTFDFDHLTLVVKGMDSEYPIPAGGYKYQGEETVKDISISFNPTFENPQSQLSFHVQSADTYYTELPLATELVIRNVGTGISPASDIEILAESLSPSEQNIALTHIPPYGHVTIPIRFDKKPLLTNDSYDFTIRVAGETLTESVHVKPFFHSWYILAAGGAIIGVFTIIIFIITRKPGRLSVS